MGSDSHDSDLADRETSAERIIPLALTVLFVTVLVQAAVDFRASENWLGKFQRLNWREELLITALIVAQVGAWRGWWWPVRCVLHAAWVFLVPFTMRIFW